MKNLKQSVCLALAAVCMYVFSISALALGAKDFSDVKEDSWFFRTVDIITQFHIIDGYPDGTFRPENDITIAEYVKTLVSFAYKQSTAPQGHWATNYMAKAEEFGLIGADEYPQSVWENPIARWQMIEISVRYMTGYRGEASMPAGGAEGVDTREYFKDKIKDWDSIPDECKETVLTAYCKGIVNGYEDGTFRSEATATRAEACAIILRTSLESERIPFSIDFDLVS